MQLHEVSPVKHCKKKKKRIKSVATPLDPSK
jgi:hypothetical protein